MKTTSFFSKSVIVLVVLLASTSMTSIKALTSQNNSKVPGPLRIAIATYDCINGGSTAIVYHPIQGFVFDTRRYQVTWYDNSGKLISGQTTTPDCLCGITVTAVVRDLHTGETKSMRHQLTRCNQNQDNAPVFLDNPATF